MEAERYFSECPSRKRTFRVLGTFGMSRTLSGIQNAPADLNPDPVRLQPSRLRLLHRTSGFPTIQTPARSQQQKDSVRAFPAPCMQGSMEQLDVWQKQGKEEPIGFYWPLEH